MSCMDGVFYVERHSRAVGCITFSVQACCCTLQPACMYHRHEVRRNSLLSFSTCLSLALAPGPFGASSTDMPVVGRAARLNHVTATRPLGPSQAAAATVSLPPRLADCQPPPAHCINGPNSRYMSPDSGPSSQLLSFTSRCAGRRVLDPMRLPGQDLRTSQYKWIN